MMRFVTVFLTVFLLCLVGCRKDKVADEPRPPTVQEINFGDKLIVGGVSEPLNLIPLLANDNSSKVVASLIYNGLVKLDSNMNTVGDLAERWELSEDGRSITFHLRQDVYWHDGMQFTADDVLFTHAFIVDTGLPALYADEFKKIVAISAMGKYTIMVEYEKLTMPALLSWSVPIMPKHLFDTVAPTKSPLQKAPVGTGPYIFDNWTFGESISLRANKAYFAGTPGIAELEFRYYNDQDSAYKELSSGKLDMLSVSPESESTAGLNEYSFPSSYSYIGYNFLRRPFNEPPVREALSLAVDRVTIIQTALAGHGRLTEGPYLPDTYWYNDQLKSTAYNPAQAATLLDEAGWTLNKDGLRMKGKQALRVTLLTNDNPVRIQIAEQIRDSWQALGVEVELKTQS
ncbi:MAG: ABC transporter substrate-binding protein, partial [Deferribacteraceae bacterium]|nr:ABC transporter substrate-binding protein [Deferribacteraceae bacterium]